MSKKAPAVLLYDIETSHNLLAAFDLYSPNNHQNIIQERYIICAAWKWLGESKVYHSKSLKGSDKNVCADLKEVMEQADAVVTHYGTKFDNRVLAARLVKHRLGPVPAHITQIDTYKIAKAAFKFNSNKLDYLGQYLGLGNKIKTTNTLWIECLAGKKSAIDAMVKYNKQDVILLEKVFKVLYPYVPAIINNRLFGNKEGCPSCGSHKIQYRGYSYTKARRYKRFQCQSCGAWGKETIADPLEDL